jgi:hypothetical protein
MVYQTFRAYGILPYLGFGRPHRGQISDAETSAFGVVLLTQSVSPVMGRLVEHGWNLGEPHQHPEDLYLLVVNVVWEGKLTAAEEQLLRDFEQAVGPAQSLTLPEYQQQVQSLKSRILAREGAGVSPLKAKAVQSVVRTLNHSESVLIRLGTRFKGHVKLRYPDIYNQLMALDPYFPVKEGLRIIAEDVVGWMPPRDYEALLRSVFPRPCR